MLSFMLHMSQKMINLESENARLKRRVEQLSWKIAGELGIEGDF